MKAINKDNTILAAILTESGASFTEDGIDYIRDMIIENHPELKEQPIIAMMGDTVSSTYKLYSLLIKNPDMFVIVSYDGGQKLSLYKPGENPELLSMLQTIAVTHSNKTACQVFSYDGKGDM